MWNLFKSKTADPMQEVQSDPTPYVMGGKKTTEDALDKVAAKYKGRAELWQRAALNTETELFKVRAERDAARDELAMWEVRARQAEISSEQHLKMFQHWKAEHDRLKASRERSNAALAAANAKRRADALAKAPAVRLKAATPPAGDHAIPAA